MTYYRLMKNRIINKGAIMEKITIYYTILKNKTVDVVVNINGKDISNYNICSYKELRNAYKEMHATFIKYDNTIE